MKKASEIGSDFVSSDKVKPKIDLNQKEVRQELHSGYNSRGRGRSPAEIRASYSRYYAVKKKAIDLESRNFSHLVLYPASDKDTNDKKFYNMGGNSAIIYSAELGPRIKRHPVLRHDMDNGSEKFHSGICSISDLPALRAKLKEIGVITKETETKDGIVVFDLRREYTKDELRAMMRQEQERLDNLNKLIYSKVLYPDIHRQILDLQKIIPSKIKDMDKTYREILGGKVIDSMFSLSRAYSMMAHGTFSEEEGAKAMMTALDELLGEISILNELKLWEVSACSRVGLIVIGAKKLIKGRILNKLEIKNEIDK